MRHHNTLIDDLLKSMPWGTFDRLVEKHGSDTHVRTLSPKRHHAQRTAGTTLADANRLRPAEVFAELFQTLLMQAHPGLRRSTKEAVRLIDSTSVSLATLSSEWASYEAHGPGAKLHVVCDPDAVTPCAFRHDPAARQRHRGSQKTATLAFAMFNLPAIDVVGYADVERALGLARENIN